MTNISSIPFFSTLFFVIIFMLLSSPISFFYTNSAPLPSTFHPTYFFFSLFFSLCHFHFSTISFVDFSLVLLSFLAFYLFLSPPSSLFSLLSLFIYLFLLHLLSSLSLSLFLSLSPLYSFPLSFSLSPFFFSLTLISMLDACQDDGFPSRL